jgi:branched-chain amino acid transport system permease protein
MRDDEIVSESLGKSTRFLKIQAITISAALAAVAGCLRAAHIGFVEPGCSDINMSILVLSMVIVGGTGNPVRGAAVGAFVLLVLQELLGFVVPITASNLASFRILLYGMMLVVFMHARRQGLSGSYKVE